MHLLVEILIMTSILYVIWQYQELKKFRIRSYTTQSKKIHREIRLAVIADLHSFSYGKNNKRLIQAVQEVKPDVILIPGDLIVTAQVNKYEISASFVEEIAKIAPVIYSNGNHESRAEVFGSDEYEPYRIYRRRLEQAGILFLNNTGFTLMLHDEPVRISGLEVPLSCYKKGKKLRLQEDFIQSQLGVPEKDKLQLLLAHNPEFAEQYAAWGADITVCGHNHGGLINIPGAGSIISSQLIWFPQYDAGEFTIGSHKVYISRGLGTHTFHIRIFNRAELVAITVKPGSSGNYTFN